MSYKESPKYHKYLLTTYGSPFIDTEEVDVHLKYLIEVREIEMQRIADATGVKYSKIRDLRAKQQQGVRREDAAALLAYSPSEVDAPLRAGRSLGVQRALQGLSAKGIGSRIVSAHSGFAKRTLDNWRMGDYRTPSVESYRRIIEAAKRLEGKTYRELGVSDHAYNQVVSRAKRAGWVPLGAWDWETIHDPNAFPDWTGHCGTHFGYQAHRRQGVEPVCEPCWTARREYQKARRAQQPGRKKGKADE